MTTDHSSLDREDAGGEPQRSLDHALRAALYEVPVPDELADRLIARLGIVEPAGLRTGDVLVPCGDARLAGAKRRRITRRQSLIAAGSLSLVALAATCGFLWRGTPPAVTRDELANHVASWLSATATKNWQPMATLPGAVQVDSSVTASARQWQVIRDSNAAGWPATVTAIDLARPQSPRAVLFVVRSRARFSVPSSPMPAVRVALSGGFAGTAWQRSSGVVYVLVVDTAHGQRLEDFVRSASQA